eukprot:365396-Chlamydomonas_euryale.AAC.7
MGTGPWLEVVATAATAYCVYIQSPEVQWSRRAKHHHRSMPEFQQSAYFTTKATATGSGSRTEKRCIVATRPLPIHATVCRHSRWVEEKDARGRICPARRASIALHPNNS